MLCHESLRKRAYLNPAKASMFFEPIRTNYNLLVKTFKSPLSLQYR